MRPGYTNHILTVRVVFNTSCDCADNVLLLPTHTLRVVCVSVSQGHQRHLCRALVVSWAEINVSLLAVSFFDVLFFFFTFIFFKDQKVNSLLGFYFRESVRRRPAELHNPHTVRGRFHKPTSYVDDKQILKGNFCLTATCFTYWESHCLRRKQIYKLASLLPLHHNNHKTRLHCCNLVYLFTFTLSLLRF